MNTRRESDQPGTGEQATSDDQREGERDALVWVAGRSLAPVLQTNVSDPVWSRAQARFLEWAGRDAAERAHGEQRRSTGSVRERAAAAPGGRTPPGGRTNEVRTVRRVDHGPTYVHPSVRGPVSRILDSARRERAAPLVELGVAAGAGRELWDEPSDVWVALPPPPGLPDRRYVALRVVGDSMLPLLHSGDIVLVDLDGEATPGGVVVARHGERGGGGYIVKRVGGRTATTMELTSLNPAYPSAHVPLDPGYLLGPVVLRWCEHSSKRVGDG